MNITFGLLCAAMLSVWLPSANFSAKLRGLAPWHVLLAAACVSGLIFHFVSVLGVLEIAVFVFLARDSVGMTTLMKRQVSLGLALLMALAFAMHKLPGFYNPKLFDNFQFSATSAPLTVYLNFDKAVVGVVLLGTLCTLIKDLRLNSRVVAAGSAIAAATVIAVLGFAFATGYVHLDVKAPAQILAFALVNLFFTCVAEEAFFRGVLQERLQQAMVSQRYGWVLALLITSGLFAVAHIGGGIQLVGFAFFAGLGYGLVYARTKSIEAAILTHLVLNTLHFAVFSYPYAI